MADETQKPPQNTNPDQYQPEGGWPSGLFPSPIVDDYFNPYENPQDKLDYFRLGGSQKTILQFATLAAQRRRTGEPGSYDDHWDMVEQARNMVEDDDKRKRIKSAFRGHRP